MKANYTYLSDGTKAKALNASGAGYDYAGTFTYSHASNGTKTLESVAFGGGRIRKSGSTYAVDYHITDHLGSVRAIVNASGSIVEQNDYYPFGNRHPNGLTQLSANRWRFSGKEEQDAAFGITYSDFGARFYDRSAVWTTIDPMAEKYYAVSPYAYCAGNPINLIDPDGNALRISHLQHKTISNLAMIAATQRGSAIISKLSEKPSLGKHVPTYNIIPVLLETSAGFDGKDIKYVVFPRLPAGFGSPSERAYFAHELSHVYDVFSESLPLPRRQDFSQRALTESNSVTLENYIRSVYGIPLLRKRYMGYDSSPFFCPNTKRLKGERVTHFKEIYRSKDGRNFGYSFISNIDGVESMNYIVAGVDRDNLFYFQQYESEEAFREATKDR